MAPTAGIDWAAEAHEVCISEEGRVNERFSATHDERGLAELARRLERHGVVRVAIERPDGVLVERLLAAGLEVLGSIPTRSRPPGPASRSPTASPIASTPTCWPSWPAPTPTASGR